MSAPTRAEAARAATLDRLADERFDLVVVGAGVTGAGVALDAAARGLKVALVDKGDLASGTSSKSSKLIHGGLRYLQQKEFRLVYDALYERQRLLRNAPHLVRVLPFMLPVLTRDGLFDRRIARIVGTSLWMYDLTGGARIGKLHERIDTAEALRHLPTLDPSNLAAAYLYYDAQADDARLVLTLARTAMTLGAAVANQCSVVGMTKDAAGRIVAVDCEADGRRLAVRTAAVVNAAGVWADEIRAHDEGPAPASLRPAKGVHLTVPWSKVRNDIAVVLPVPRDKRSLFVVPHGDLTYIGTTDTDYDGPLDDPPCTRADVDYVLGAVNHWLSTKLADTDVLGTWAGLRPLVRSTAVSARTADLSRRHRVTRSASGVVTVTGGKLTTYREMAADAVDEVCEVLGVEARSRTKRLVLLGGEGYVAPPEDGSGDPVADHLGRRYGTLAGQVRALVTERPELGEPLVPGLPYLRAEAVYAVRHELARTVDDVLSRRTRARLLARDDSAIAAGALAELIGPELGWDAAEQRRQVEAYRASVSLERTGAELPETALATAFGA